MVSKKEFLEAAEAAEVARQKEKAFAAKFFFAAKENGVVCGVKATDAAIIKALEADEEYQSLRLERRKAEATLQYLSFLMKREEAND